MARPDPPWTRNQKIELVAAVTGVLALVVALVLGLLQLNYPGQPIVVSLAPNATSAVVPAAAPLPISMPSLVPNPTPPPTLTSISPAPTVSLQVPPETLTPAENTTLLTKVGWRQSYKDGGPGACLDNCVSGFLAWQVLQQEVEAGLLPQVPDLLSGSTLRLDDAGAKRNWIVSIVTRGNEKIGLISFGGDPEQNWAWDGLVHVVLYLADTRFYAFGRYADGSYRRYR